MTDSVVKTWAAEMRSMRTIAITIVLVITCLQLRVENAFATAEGCAVVAKTPDGFLNIRQTPSSDGPVLGQVTPGDFVAIVRDMKGDPSGKWSYLSRSFEVVGNKVIKERNISGWAATRYLAIECPENLQQIVLHRPSFSVGGMRLSQTINLGSNFRCKTSDQFTDFDWCIAASQERGARGEFEQRTTVLRSSDGRAFYLNRFLEPAFFAPKEIEHDIDDLIAKFGEKPVMLSMPKRTGLRGGIIAKWGGLTLHQLTKEQAAPLAEGQSPKVGLLVDFLNDFMTSAKRDLPLYR